VNCIIIDDETHAIELLTQHIKQTPSLHLVYSTTNPLEGINVIQQQKIDLAFVDVQMPELSGLDVINATKGKTNFVLCTAFAEYALDGFEHDVIDYLLKPVTYARFIKAVIKFTNYTQSPVNNSSPAADFLFIKTEQKGKLARIDYDEIDYIEGMKNYVAFHTAKGKKAALLNMKFLQENLPPDRFIRVHNSFIVPKNRIILIEGNEVVLKGDMKRLPIGITYKENLLEALNIK